MIVPRWDDETLKAGTMVKTALWLVSEVGEGNVFTKEQHRQAFPGVSQADRRMRDLRDFGWVIHTSSDDVTLRQEEQRFVKPGLSIWDPEVRRQAERATNLTAKQRQAVFAADGYQCVVCGVAAGESYVDSPNLVAVLAISRRQVALPGIGSKEMHVTECKRCRAGGSGDETHDVGRILSDIGHLDDADRRRLLRWMQRDRRGATPLDRIWNSYRRLPADARKALQSRLSEDAE